jgi:hypothetical protein
MSLEAPVGRLGPQGGRVQGGASSVDQTFGGFITGFAIQRGGHCGGGFTEASVPWGLYGVPPALILSFLLLGHPEMSSLLCHPFLPP